MGIARMYHQRNAAGPEFSSIVGGSWNLLRELFRKRTMDGRNIDPCFFKYPPVEQ
jgi:hypothetical protein